MRPLPLVDVKAQYEPLLPRIREAIDGVLDSGAFILGPNVAAFEREAAAYLGVPATRRRRERDGCARPRPRRAGHRARRRGRLSLVHLLRHGRGGGAPRGRAGLRRRRRRDDEPRPGGRLSPDHAPDEGDHRRSTSSAARLPRELADLGVPLVEDAAQAFGSPDIGRTGIASTFSFYPTKNLFCLGDGGLVGVTDEELGERIRVLRFHGSRDKVDFELVGYNSRLDELQAAVLRIFLGELDAWVRLRREAAARYADLGLGAACELPEDEPGHAYHLFVCRSTERDRIRSALDEARIGSAVYYVTPLHLQPALAYLGYRPGSLPVTEQLARENFSVPLWAGIDADAQERVVSVVQTAAPVAS